MNTSLSLGLALVLCGCLKPYPTDWDEDGFVSELDCDDVDASVHPNATEICDGIDNDCDDVLPADEIDDDNDGYVECTIDSDGWNGDPIQGGGDCDDGDATSTTQSIDADCDGTLTADDCNDSDPGTVNDMDCDGVSTANDCDDANAGLGDISLDADCDGVLTGDDCDDGDPGLGDIFLDADCDRVLTATDCDDGNSGLGDIALDADCDGVLTADDCNDTDPNIYPWERYGEAGCGWTSVSSGFKHTCGLNSDGVVECWGIQDRSGDDYGQVSDTPVDSSFLSVSAGHSHSCGVNSDEVVVCWGVKDLDPNPDGCGQSIPADCGQSIPPPGTFLSVSAGYKHTCGVNSNEFVECWGRDNENQVTDTPSGVSFLSVSASGSHACGVRNDNNAVECWGIVGESDNNHGQVSQAPTDSFFKSVSAGHHHTCGVQTDGVVECWGRDDFDQSSPPAGTFESVSAGFRHSCGVNTDGVVECWGIIQENSNENQGQVTNTPGGQFLSVSAGWEHTCGVKIDGSVTCWGWDNDGQSTPP